MSQIQALPAGGHALNAFKLPESVAANRLTAQAPNEAAAEKVADFLLTHAPTAVVALSGATPEPRAPQRGQTTVAEAPKVVQAAAGIDAAASAADALRGMMARTSPLVDGVFKAVANGTIEAPERIKAGTEFAALRSEMNAFHADVTGTDGGLEGIVGSLGELRASGLLDSGDTPALNAKLDSLLAMDKDELIEQTRTDALMSLMVLLMGLLMLMKEADRNLSTAALQKAETFVAQAGERLVQGAEEHKKGAVIALATSATIAVAGLGASVVGAVKQTKSIQNHSREAIKKNDLADAMDFGGAKDLARAGKGVGLTDGQSRILSAPKLRTQARALEAKANMSANQNAMWGQGGHSLGQMGSSAGNIAQADADVKAADKTRLQQNLQKASETAKAESDHAKQRADEQGSMQSQVESKMSSILDESHGAVDAINRNMA